MRGVLACPASPFSESPKHLWLSQGLAVWVAHVPGNQHWDDGRSQVGNISSFALPLLDSEQLESLVWWHCGSAQARKCVRTHFTFGRSGAISWLFPCCVPLLRVRRCPKVPKAEGCEQPLKQRRPITQSCRLNLWELWARLCEACWGSGLLCLLSAALWQQNGNALCSTHAILVWLDPGLQFWVSSTIFKVTE